MSAALDLIRDPDRAAALLSGPRLRILSALREPDTAAGLSRRLGEPRQRLGHHLRALEKAGLVETVEERRKGNVMERLLRATATHYAISPEVLGELAVDPGALHDRFSSAWLAAQAAETLRVVGRLQAAAQEQGKRVATLGLEVQVAFADAGARKEFAEDLATCVAQLVQRHHDPEASGARRFRFTMGAHPVLPDTADVEEQSA